MGLAGILMHPKNGRVDHLQRLVMGEREAPMIFPQSPSRQRNEAI
jgi:hypothetical protein